MRFTGTIARGIRTPILKEKDNLIDIVVDSVMKASQNEQFELRDKDIVAITEAVVSIVQGNYVSVDDVATDIKNKFPNGHIGIVFPILSRNRFALCLKGFARGAKKITMLLSYPSDEVGNPILEEDRLSEYKINPYSDIISENKYKELFGDFVHIFTGVNMIDFYRDIAKNEGCEIEFVLSNNPITILEYTKDVLYCDIHTREKTRKKLTENGAQIVYGMSDIMRESINGSGSNKEYGLLGSNRSTEERLKLFPTNGQVLVDDIQRKFKELTNKNIEVMIYGDGAFKDPIGGIWELADPVVSPFYTSGLSGTPNELKLKYISDNKFASLRGEELNNAIREEIKNKDKNLMGKIETQGTTPRRITDLVGSLCDLTSGSGDKGTPVVLVQGYFDNYADM
ncbi:MAG: coenzyme F420-0:L-glutamate ligase [Bacilli bacterium]|nr:coenzyme F420-0:L-glutamate ligase [Bacilli bacterium]